MSVVKSVEYIEFALTGATLDQVNLTKGQDPDACTPFMTMRGDGSVADELAPWMCDVYFDDNLGTARLNVESKTGTTLITASIYVIEWDLTKVNVQQGTINVADTAASGTATITAVDLDKAYVQAFLREGTTAPTDLDRASNFLCDAKFNSTTQIQVTRDFTEGDLTGTYYVVECIGTEFAVQTANPSLTLTGTSGDDTITAVVLAKSFLVTGLVNEDTASPDIRDYAAQAHLSTTTNVNLSRDGGGTPNAAMTSTIFVVECANTEWDVQRHQVEIAPTDISELTTINEVDLTRSVLIMGTYCNLSVPHVDTVANDDLDNFITSLDFSNATTVRSRRKNPDAEVSAHKFEAVEFELAAAAHVLPKYPRHMIR